MPISTVRSSYPSRARRLAAMRRESSETAQNAEDRYTRPLTSKIPVGQMAPNHRLKKHPHDSKKHQRVFWANAPCKKTPPATTKAGMRGLFKKTPSSFKKTCRPPKAAKFASAILAGRLEFAFTPRCSAASCRRLSTKRTGNYPVPPLHGAISVLPRKFSRTYPRHRLHCST